MSQTLILIPARMAASRLPNKPLADICGKPMILHVFERAMAAKIGPVVVATDSLEIKSVVEAAGGKAVMTAVSHPSGSDRIFEALNLYDPVNQFSRIINVQGDLPTLDPALIKAASGLLEDNLVDISTLVTEITRDDEKTNENVVKCVGSPVNDYRLRALYFTRATAPWGEGPLYHHIGLYGYRRKALERFVKLPPSTLELREKLEQLRALEAGMRIDAAIVKTLPLGVDTPHDLDRARDILSKNG